MKEMKLLGCALVFVLLLTAAGCSGEGAVDLGGTAGSGHSQVGASAGAASATPLSTQLSEIHVQVGDTEYNYSCDGVDQGSGALWTGPSLDANAYSRCDWRSPKPRLTLDVLFTDFLLSEGFPAGTYDLSQPTVQNLAVRFSVENQVELPVGQANPYTIYASTALNPFGNAPSAPAAGVSGTVTVAKFGPDPRRNGSYVFDVSVSNVVLSQVETYGQNLPATVHIKSAHLMDLIQ